MDGDIMKKRTPARLYPKKEDVTIKNILLEDRNLLILLLLIIIIFSFIIACLFSIPSFQGEHVYNALGSI